MARRREAAKRKMIPDPVYGSDVVAKFINTIMKSGKKSIAEKIVYGAIEELARKVTKHSGHDEDKSAARGSKGYKHKEKLEPSLEIFFRAIDNVSPVVEVKAKRVGGSTYQIPVEVRPERRQTLSMRWLIESAQARVGQSMAKRLAAEMMDAAENRGGAVKKKEETHRMAKANQAFAHIRSN
jgi:small subunit ribosomal protein S7